jgi:hypothetical protein
MVMKLKGTNGRNNSSLLERKISVAALMEAYEKPITVSDAKTGFLEFARKAAMGIEIVAKNRNTSEQVSILGTPLVSAMLDTMRFTIDETQDHELGTLTIAINELPVYGEGKTRDEAIDDLIYAILEYEEIYLGQIDIYNKVDTPLQQAYMLKLLRCGQNREAIKKSLEV